MSKNQLDPRVRRTREAFQNSLLQLLKTKRFEKIRVKEIAQGADLSRNAFYSHFETKEDLLFSYADDLFESIIQTVYDDFGSAVNVDLFALFKASFDLWKANVDVMRYVLQVEKKELVITRFRAHTEAMVTIYLGKQTVETTQHELSDYVFDFAAGGGFMLLQRWINDGMIHDSEQMAQLMVDIAPFNTLLGGS